MRNRLGPALLVALFAAAGVRFVGAADESEKNTPGTKQSAEASLDQEALEKAFAEKMSGAVFSGSYSVTNADGKESAAQMEKYTIAKVAKVKDDLWTFTARIEYGKNNVFVPMALQVKWAGDTPVITLTDLTIPGLGTFTSRVMIYGDRYAGTWQHGKTGGHLWGRVEKAPVADAPEKGK